MDSDSLILVVDDSSDSRLCVRRILEGAGFRVVVAEDGEEALEILSAEEVDLIIADIAMPRMNGYEFFEMVTQEPSWVTIPFIFLSGRTLDSDVYYALLMGIDAYITKPFRAKQLLTTVQGRLQRRKLLQQAAARQTGSKQGEAALTCGALRIDPHAYNVSLNDNEIALSSREFQLLQCLAENQGRVVSLTEIVKMTHGLDTDSQEAGSLIRPLVRSVRRKLGYGPGEWGCIRSVRGVGYEMVIPNG